MTDYEFRVREWSRFQHYKKRAEDGKPTRRPSWIKTYTKLLSDPAYRGISDTQRALLHGIWLWWADQDLAERWSGLNVEMMNGLLALNARISTWKALETHGFIELRASTKAGDIPAAAMPDEEESREERTTSTSNAAEVVDLESRRKTDYRGIEEWDPGTRDVLSELLERRNG